MPIIPRSERTASVSGQALPYSVGDGYSAPGRAQQQLGNALGDLGGALSEFTLKAKAERDELDNFEGNMLVSKFKGDQDVAQQKHDASVSGDARDHTANRLAGYDQAASELQGKLPNNPKVQRKVALHLQQMRASYGTQSYATQERQVGNYYAESIGQHVTERIIPGLTGDMASAETALQGVDSMLAGTPGLREDMKAHIRKNAAAAVLKRWQEVAGPEAAMQADALIAKFAPTRAPDAEAQEGGFYGEGKPARESTGLTASDRGLALIRRQEGFRPNAYWDVKGYSVGYGSFGVSKGAVVTREEAEGLMRKEIGQIEGAMASKITVPITQNQHDSLVSFFYNLGTGKGRLDKVAEMINSGNAERVPGYMRQLTRANGQELPALVRRRGEEARLFGTADTRMADASNSIPQAPRTSADYFRDLVISNHKQIAQGARQAERQIEIEEKRALTQLRAHNARVGWQMFRKGQLTPEWLSQFDPGQPNEAELSTSMYRMLSHAANPEDAVRVTDFRVFTDLMDQARDGRFDAQEVITEASTLFRARKLRKEHFERIVGLAVDRQSKEAGEPPDVHRQRLGIRKEIFPRRDASDDEFKAYAETQQQFDEAAALMGKEPEAAKLKSLADDLIKRHKAGAINRASAPRAELPMPSIVRVPREAMSLDEVRAAGARLQEQRKAGLMSEKDIEDQAMILQRWQDFLTKEAIAKGEKLQPFTPPTMKLGGPKEGDSQAQQPTSVFKRIVKDAEGNIVGIEETQGPGVVGHDAVTPTPGGEGTSIARDTYGMGYQNPMLGMDSADLSTADVVQRMASDEAYRSSVFGQISEFLKGQDQKLTAAAKAEGQDDASMFNPFRLALQGLESANHWFGAAGGHPDKVAWNDMLAPLGAAAMTAPFMPRGAVGSAGGRLAGRAGEDGAGSSNLPKGVELTHEAPGAKGGSHTFVLSKDGDVIGEAKVEPLEKNLFSIAEVNIDEAFQRQGIGSALYDQIERTLGGRLVPSATLTEGSYRIWKKRNPAILRHYEHLGDGEYALKDDVLLGDLYAMYNDVHSRGTPPGPRSAQSAVNVPYRAVVRDGSVEDPGKAPQYVRHTDKDRVDFMRSQGWAGINFEPELSLREPRQSTATGQVAILDPSAVRVLRPGDQLRPGEIRAYHGTNEAFDKIDPVKFQTFESSGDITGAGFYAHLNRTVAEGIAKSRAHDGGRPTVIEVAFDGRRVPIDRGDAFENAFQHWLNERKRLYPDTDFRQVPPAPPNGDRTNASGAQSGILNPTPPPGPRSAQSAVNDPSPDGISVGSVTPPDFRKIEKIPRESRADLWRARTDDAEHGGAVEGLVNKERRTLEIFSAGIPEEARGQGRGVDAYARLIQEAHAEGLAVHSDSSVSPSALRVYEALARRGYDIHQNPAAQPYKDGLVVDQGGPVFVVRPRDPTKATRQTVEDQIAQARHGSTPPPGPPHDLEAFRKVGFDPDGKWYHGTPEKTPFAEFGEQHFAKRDAFLGNGVYLTSHKPFAESYFKRAHGSGPAEGGRVLDVQPRLSKIFLVDHKDHAGTAARIKAIYPEFADKTKDGAPKVYTFAEEAEPFRQAMMRAGYDAIYDPDLTVSKYGINDDKGQPRSNRLGTLVVFNPKNASIAGPESGIKAYHGSPPDSKQSGSRNVLDGGRDYGAILRDAGQGYERAHVIGPDGKVLHNPVKGRESLGGPAVWINEDGSVRKGIIAYHGSPHDFDRFSMEHVGKGEGAQSYGHGLYFAENEGVAGTYRASNSGVIGGIPKIDKATIGGTPIDWQNPEHIAAAFLTQNRGSRHQAYLMASSADAPGRPSNERAAIWQAAALLHNNSRDLAHLPKVDGIEFPPPGRMYEVRINAQPEDFLDWDKPLRGQTEKIRAIMDGLGVSNEVTFSRVKQYPRNGKKAQADALREAGIPGIKYLDQGSRTKGEGTYNYVLFDDSLVEIVKKYGGSEILSDQKRASIPGAILNAMSAEQRKSAVVVSEKGLNEAMAAARAAGEDVGSSPRSAPAGDGAVSKALRLEPTMGDEPTLRHAEPRPGLKRLNIVRGDAFAGKVEYRVRGNSAYIDWIELEGTERLTLGDIRALREEFRKLHPNVRRFTGERISGAKGGLHIKDSRQTVTLRSDEDQLPAFLISAMNGELNSDEEIKNAIRKEASGFPPKAADEFAPTNKSAGEKALGPAPKLKPFNEWDPKLQEWWLRMFGKGS